MPSLARHPRPRQ